MEINKKNLKLQQSLYIKILNELEGENINQIRHINDLSETDYAWLETYYLTHIYPLINIMSIDNYHDFSNIKNLSLHILVTYESDHPKTIISVPDQTFRVILLPNTQNYLLIEEVILHFLGSILNKNQIKSTSIFRLTKDMCHRIEENMNMNFSTQMKEFLRFRERDKISRLEIVGKRGEKIEEVLTLSTLFDITSTDDIYYSDLPLDLTYLGKLVKILKNVFPNLSLSKLHTKKYDVLEKNIYKKIEEDDVLLYHPFDSFSPVIDFIEKAVNDKDTMGIKQTLYRVAANSKIVKLLCQAAWKGIRVDVIIELKARSDEENNLKVAEMLRKSGCQVIYGKRHLKIHSKAILVTKKSGKEIKQYVHIGTGNYNEDTAKMYTDFSLFSARKSLVYDVNNFFNSIEGSHDYQYIELMTSPDNIFFSIIKKIQDVINSKKQTGIGNIVLKVNSLTNKEIIFKLYEASQAGVDIILIVRGACCLVPGIQGISDNIQVFSFIGRFLEHSRAYVFNTCRTEEIWISSADLMDRNLFERYELAVKLSNSTTKRYFKEILATYLNHTELSFKMNRNGGYIKRAHYFFEGSPLMKLTSLEK